MSHIFRKDTASYFDYRPREHHSSTPGSPVSPGFNPGSARSGVRPAPVQPCTRSQSECDIAHKTVHVHTIEADKQRQRVFPYRLLIPTILDQELENVITTGHSRQSEDDVASTADAVAESIEPRTSHTLPGSGSHGSHDSGKSHLRDRRRVGQTWTRSPSGSLWFSTKSSISRPQTPDSEMLPVRNDQTPLRPPALRNVSLAENPSPNSITVETGFESSRGPRTPVPGPSRERWKEDTSRRSSFNPRHIFSIPVLLMRRASQPQRRGHRDAALLQHPTPIPSSARLADHISLLKKNYTSEALHRVAAILHDSKSSPSANSQPSSWPPKPLRLKTLSDKSTARKGQKSPRTSRGITKQFTANMCKSADQVSDTASYTSSQRNLRMGPQPTNTPDERATYKVKRSASADTEEFLKVDISIRGGTSYLPSEARRVHTPPLPEETVDGRWRGFFFDYNAPRRTDSPHCSTRAISSVTNSETGPSNPPPATGGMGVERSRSKKTVKGDWYDVKLAEVDQAGELDMFDLTIPEHLPTSPLCPRNPWYWRAKGGGPEQHFRGCWMHGIGVEWEEGASITCITEHA